MRINYWFLNLKQDEGVTLRSSIIQQYVKATINSLVNLSSKFQVVREWKVFLNSLAALHWHSKCTEEIWRRGPSCSL